MAIPRDPGGRPRAPLKRHSSFPLPKPEIQRSAPPKRRPVLGPPAPKPRPTGVFAQPITAPTQTLRHAQHQAAKRTRRAAAKIPQPAPTIPVIAPRNQPRGYRQAVQRVAGPMVQRVHDRATKQAIRDARQGGNYGGSYRQSVSAQLDALGPQARKLFRAYLEIAKPGSQQAIGAIRRDQQRRVAQGLPPTSQLQAIQHGKRSALQQLAGASPLGALTAVPNFLAGAVARRADESGASNLAGVLRLAREPQEIARTYVEHPGTVARDFGYVRDTVLGMAAIPYNFIRDPAGTVRSLPGIVSQAPRALIQDEITRHKAAFEGNYGKFRETVRQTGAIPYGFDYATGISGLAKGAGVLAKGGTLGRRLEEFANRPRAQMRIAPGEVRRQRDESRKAAPNLLRQHYQGRRDVRRAAAYDRRERKAQQRAAEFNRRGEPGQGNRRFVQPQAYPGAGPGKVRASVRQLAARRQAVEHTIERAGGKLHRDARGRVESVRFTAERAASSHPAHFNDVAKRLEQMGFERRRVGGNLVFYAPKEVTRRSVALENRGIRSIPAHLKGVAVSEIRGVTADEAHAFQQAAGPSARALRLKGLSKHERAALFLAGTGRLPVDNPARAVERLNAIEARIRSEIGSKPRTRFETDTLQRIAYLRQHAEQAFTPRLRRAVEQIRTQVKRGERADPFRIPRQQLAATYGPGALELGVERGTRTVEAFDPVASAKSIARNAERQSPRPTARERRRGFVRGEGTMRDRDRALRNEQTRLLERDRHDGVRETRLRELVARAEELEKRRDDPVAVARAGNLRTGPIAEIVKEKTRDWMRGNAIARERDMIDAEIQRMAREGVISGRPEADVAAIPWFHGTNLRYEGPPTAVGKRSDLGAYLTSDPGYALWGYAGGAEAVARGEGRVMQMRVRPRKVLETRFGKGVDPDFHATIADSLLKRYEQAIEAAHKVDWDRAYRRMVREVEAESGWKLTDRPRGEGPGQGIRPEIRQKLGLLATRYGDHPITRDPRARNLLAQIRKEAKKEADRSAEWARQAGWAQSIRDVADALRNNTHFRMAVQTGEGSGTEIMHAGEKATYLDAWREFDRSLRGLASEITSKEVRGGLRQAREGLQEGTGPLRELYEAAGIDALRKVDVHADTLVVLDEKLLGRRARSDEVRQWLVDGAKRERGETTAEWVKRVRRAMDENGIDHPPFFAPSEELRTPKFSIYTAGGARSPEPPKLRTYVLQRQGRERTDPEIIYEGIQRNHRKRISAQLVVDVFDRVAHPRYRNMATHELKKLAQKEGFDPSLYAVWYPKLYRDTLRNRWVGEQEGAAAGAGSAATNLETAAAAQGAAFGHLKDLLDPSSKDSAIVAANNVRDLYAQLDNPRFKAERGTLIPRAAADELLSSSKETAFGRLMERLKTAQSRAVLGALNLNWVQADALVNSLVATVIGGASPAAFVQQRAFFRNLPADLRRFAHDELDVGTARSNTHIPRMGATVNNRFVNFFRLWRESPWGQRLRPIQRTINTFLKAERAVGNNPQRRALAYHLLRKEAFRQLDTNVGHLNGVLNRVASIFSGGAYTPASVQKQMVQIIRNKREFEQIGRATADILGDWTTFTALERKTLGRYFFFYPYLRYSMKLAFYTLPLDHPVRLAILANLANLNMDEQRRLIGATEADTYLVAGRYFYRDDKGAMHEYNVRTFNPIGNVVTESQTSADLLQLMPPVFTIALGQIEKRDIYRGRDWRVKGTANREAGKDIGPLDGLLGTTRWRVLAKQLIELPPLTREIAKYMLPGEQGDDSLPFSPRPTVFKDPERQAQANKKLQREKVSLAQRFLQDQFRAFTPKTSDITDVLQRRHAHLPGGAGAKGKPAGMSQREYDTLLREARREAQSTGTPTKREQDLLLREARQAAGVR